MVYDTEIIKDPNRILDRMIYGGKILTRRHFGRTTRSSCHRFFGLRSEYSITYGKYSHDELFDGYHSKPGILVMSDLYTRTGQHKLITGQSNYTGQIIHSGLSLFPRVLIPSLFVMFS
jgi:hypothetical protein